MPTMICIITAVIIAMGLVRIVMGLTTTSATNVPRVIITMELIVSAARILAAQFVMELESLNVIIAQVLII